MCCVSNADDTVERIFGGAFEIHSILRWGGRGELVLQLTLMSYPEMAWK